MIQTPGEGSVIVLNDTNLSNNALFLSWSSPDSDADFTYLIEAARTGTDFESPVIMGTSDITNFGMSVEELNTFLLEEKATKKTIIECIWALELLKNEFIKKHHLSKKNQIWLNRNLAGMLADTLLIRGGVIKNVHLSVLFIWNIKKYWSHLIVQSINNYIKS